MKTNWQQRMIYRHRPKGSEGNSEVLDGVTLDETMSPMAAFDMAQTRMDVAASIQSWLETNDLDEGEGMADRLFSMMVGIVDANQDGELDDDEQMVLSSALESAWSYLEKFGVAEDDISALLNDWDNDAAERVYDLLVSAVPMGDDADADMDGFAFEDQSAVFDSAVYKKVMAVRGGKKVKINKRISGTVRLSAKQKVAIRKAQMKARSAGAKARRARSMKKRVSSGL